MQSHNATRRTVLKATGASLTVAAFAGCLGSDDDDGGEDPGNDDDNGGDEVFEIESGESIVFDGYSSHWEGLEPASIEGEENPTLQLEDGGEYTMEWINADGATHDLDIQDDGGETVNDLVTDPIGDVDEGASLEFTATSEMAQYVCNFHSQQVGDLIVE